MLRTAVLIFMVFFSNVGFSQADESRLNRFEREISSFDYFFMTDEHACTPKCGGHPSCSEFTEMNSCLDESHPAAGCFWSCED